MNYPKFEVFDTPDKSYVQIAITGEENAKPFYIFVGRKRLFEILMGVSNFTELQALIDSGEKTFLQIPVFN